MRSRPVIAVSTYRQPAVWGHWERDAALVPGTYVDAVAQAGGIPVMAPPLDGSAWSEEVVSSAFDGVLLAGGGDVDPTMYGAQADPRTGGVSTRRDRSERALLTAALSAHLPVLAICRGMQLLNVALGGDLDQHLPDRLVSNAHQPAPGSFGNVEVETVAGSLVQSIYGIRCVVPCSHHQAVNRVADRLSVTARSIDGAVEALELEGSAFVLGVQWHPEERGGEDLFRAFVEAAAAR